MDFVEEIVTEAQLREITGEPNPRVLKKQLSVLDSHCLAFIANSPFMLISSGDAAGRMDISPRGDPPGFVLALDEQTLAIPDRPGNRRSDTFRNVLQNPNVGTLFLIPGRQDTLRVNGSARIVKDQWLRERMAVNGKVPEIALVVTVREAFLHCPKSIIRSQLWDADAWPALDALPTFAQAMIEQAGFEKSVEQMQELIDRDSKDRLY